ncbi:hypothetical protein BC940DRAFT_302593 [Gongronella butleri]|nr:hypothetical protein BC940DRAFT_302593 [Gongronella butleri]
MGREGGATDAFRSSFFPLFIDVCFFVQVPAVRCVADCRCGHAVHCCNDVFEPDVCQSRPFGSRRAATTRSPISALAGHGAKVDFPVVMVSLAHGCIVLCAHVWRAFASALGHLSRRADWSCDFPARGLHARDCRQAGIHLGAAPCGVAGHASAIAAADPHHGKHVALPWHRPP